MRVDTPYSEVELYYPPGVTKERLVGVLEGIIRTLDPQKLLGYVSARFSAHLLELCLETGVVTNMEAIAVITEYIEALMFDGSGSDGHVFVLNKLNFTTNDLATLTPLLEELDAMIALLALPYNHHVSLPDRCGLLVAEYFQSLGMPTATLSEEMIVYPAAQGLQKGMPPEKVADAVTNIATAVLKQPRRYGALLKGNGAAETFYAEVLATYDRFRAALAVLQQGPHSTS